MTKDGEIMDGQPTVTPGTRYADDGRVTFPSKDGPVRDSAWLTLDMGVDGWRELSLNIIRTDEGVVLDLYVFGEEDRDGGPIATTYALAQDGFMKEGQ
jgi:hypothetical protein